jgi:hypothetical protein
MHLTGEFFEVHRADYRWERGISQFTRSNPG